MRPSSTSSSDERPPRHWGRVALIVLLLLGTTEAALRLPQVRAVLPPRTHYYHPTIAQRIDALERVLTVHKRIDVLFIGSSIVLTNVHPMLFDHLVSEQPRKLVSFNAGMAGLWPTSVHLYAEHLWLPKSRPRIVVQGVRYPELATSTHAKNETQVWSGNIESAWRESDLVTRLYSAAAAHVHLLQYRGAVPRALERFRYGWAGAYDAELDDSYASRGYTPMGGSGEDPAEREAPDLPSDGTCDREKCAVGFAALHRTIAAVHATGASYVLVNVPEHAARWRGAGGVERYRHYVETLRAFADVEGVAFIDPTEGDPFRFAQTPFNDLSHMTAAGSRQFTRALAERMAPLMTVAMGVSPPREGFPTPRRRNDQCRLRSRDAQAL